MSSIWLSNFEQLPAKTLNMSHVRDVVEPFIFQNHHFWVNCNKMNWSNFLRCSGGSGIRWFHATLSAKFVYVCASCQTMLALCHHGWGRLGENKVKEHERTWKHILKYLNLTRYSTRQRRSIRCICKSKSTLLRHPTSVYTSMGQNLKLQTNGMPPPHCVCQFFSETKVWITD